MESGLRTVTPLLDLAVARARELSPDQQDTLASLLLEEVGSEAAWDRSLAGSQDLLARLADEAAAERAAAAARVGGERTPP